MPKDARAGVLGRIGPTVLLLVVEGLERERGNVWLMVSGISHYKHIYRVHFCGSSGLSVFHIKDCFRPRFFRILTFELF